MDLKSACAKMWKLAHEHPDAEIAIYQKRADARDYDCGLETDEVPEGYYHYAKTPSQKINQRTDADQWFSHLYTAFSNMEGIFAGRIINNNRFGMERSK